VTTGRKRLTIFISHASGCLTDFRPHGDGLAAFEFIRRLAMRGHKVHVAAAGAEIRGELPPGVYLHALRLRSPFSFMRPFEYLLRVRTVFRRVMRDSAVDIIHQLNPVKPGMSFSLLWEKVPIVLGLFVPKWPVSDGGMAGRVRAVRKWPERCSGSILRFMDGMQQRMASVILLSTPAAAARLTRPEDKRDRTFELPYGVDTERFFPQKEDACSDVLYLGRICRCKGVFDLLEAFGRISEASGAVRLTMAGDGPDLAALRMKTAGMPCADRISIPGVVDREAVPARMRRCAVYCQPSYGEPFGISVLEAMACAKPVIAADGGGVRYLFSEEGGRRFSEGDIGGLSRALEELLSYRQAREGMGIRNRLDVEKKYEWDGIIGRLESIYYRVTGHEGG